MKLKRLMAAVLVAITFLCVSGAQTGMAAASNSSSEIKPAAVSQSTLAFPDIDPTNQTLLEAAALLKTAGVISGDENGLFNPNDILTRAQMAKIGDLIYRISEGMSTDVPVAKSAFTDVSGWATGYIEDAYNNGIIQGNGEGVFNPDGELTDAATVTIALRLIGKGSELQQLKEQGISWDAAAFQAAEADGRLLSGTGMVLGTTTTRAQAVIIGANALRIISALSSENDANIDDSLQIKIFDNQELNQAIIELEKKYDILNVHAIDKDVGTKFLEEFYLLEEKYGFPNHYGNLADRYSALYQTIIDLTLEITKNDTSQLQKAKSIYAWRTSGLNNKSSSNVGELARSVTLGTPLYVFYHNSGNCLYQAWLTQYMLNIVGIENKICSGSQGGGAGNGGTSHYWNYANLDGTWYFMDAYWEQPGTPPDQWRYFSTTPFEDHKVFIGWDKDL